MGATLCRAHGSLDFAWVKFEVLRDNYWNPIVTPFTFGHHVNKVTIAPFIDGGFIFACANQARGVQFVIVPLRIEPDFPMFRYNGVIIGN